MGRIVSFRGQLDMGVQEMIPLSTIKGLIGYKVKKFQILSASPGTGNVEMIGQIYKTNESTNVNSTPNFSDNRLLGVALYHDGAANDTTHFMATTIFDNEKFNQDIYVNITDATGSTIRGNYYIELEQMSLDLSEQTVATLKDIRNVGAE
jgi:hypothetical protein